MKNLKQILKKLTAAMPLPEPSIGPDQSGKCPGSTGKIGSTDLLVNPPGKPERISQMPLDTTWVQWSKIQENKIKAYFFKVNSAIRACDTGSDCKRASNFNACFKPKHDKAVRELENKEFKVSMVMPMEDAIAAVERFIMDPAYEPSAPLDQNAPKPTDQMRPTEKRNCELRKDRCLCDFYTKKATYMSKAAEQEMLYKNECGPYFIGEGLSEEERAKREQANKEKLAKACKKIKEDFDPDSSPCKKKQDGKYYFNDCKEFCEKCSQGEPSPEGIEGTTF